MKVTAPKMYYSVSVRVADNPSANYDTTMSPEVFSNHFPELAALAPDNERDEFRINLLTDLTQTIVKRIWDMTWIV